MSYSNEDKSIVLKKFHLVKVLDYHCPVDMRRGACLEKGHCHFLLDAAQGKLNCRVHRGNVGASLGFMLHEDMKVIKGQAVHIWGLLGTSLAWCTTVARYMTGES